MLVSYRFHAPAALTPGKEPLLLVDWGTVVGSRVGLCVLEKRNFLRLPGFEPRIIQPVA
jgi:hypothetical protein